jgi:hypothetical protein
MFHCNPHLIPISEGTSIMENNNRKTPHIRRIAHIMMYKQRQCFHFSVFNG